MALGAIGEAKNSFVHEQRSEESDRETLRFAQGDRPAVLIFYGLIERGTISTSLSIMPQTAFVSTETFV